MKKMQQVLNVSPNKPFSRNNQPLKMSITSKSFVKKSPEVAKKGSTTIQ
jgi:hypothetical protein